MCPPLPGVYFGNAIARTSTTVTKVKDIVSSPLNAVADMVSFSATRLSDEYIRSLVDYLELAMNDATGLYLGQWIITNNDLLVMS
jgi:omega-hydroxypalmitate O-feruloyl transferase